MNIAYHQNRIKKVAAAVATASVHDVALAPHPSLPGAQQHEITGRAKREQSKLAVQDPCWGDKCEGGKMRNACSNAEVRKNRETNKNESRFSTSTTQPAHQQLLHLVVIESHK